MKATLRIPTKEYAYIELNEVDVENMAEAHEKYLELERIITGEVGLSTKEWNEALDKYLSTNSLTEGEYMSMSAEQKHIIQEIKKCVKRINRKEGLDDSWVGASPGKGENGDYSNMD